MKRKIFTYEYFIKFTAIVLLQLLLGSNSLILANKPLLQHQKKANTETSKNVSTELDNTITVDVKNVELDSVLRFFSQNFNFSYTLSQALKDKTVTIKVQDQAWNKILENTLKENNLGYNRIGTVVYIFPLKNTVLASSR